jgi:hypothetical protein
MFRKELFFETSLLSEVGPAQVRQDLSPSAAND